MKRLLGFLALAAVAIFLASAGLAEAKLYNFQIGGVDHIAEYSSEDGLIWASWKENGKRVTVFNRERMEKFVAKSKYSSRSRNLKAKAGFNFQPTMATAPVPIATAKKVETPVNRGLTSTNDQQSPPFHNGFQAQKNAPKVQSASSSKKFADSNVINKPSFSSSPVAPVIGAQKQGQPASKIAAIAPHSFTPAVVPETNKTQKPLAVNTPKVRPEGSRYDSSAVTPDIQKSVASAPKNFRSDSKYDLPAVTPDVKNPASAPQKFAGKNIAGNTAEQSTVSDIEVQSGYYQWPQKTPDGDWNDLGHCLERINPHTAQSERVEKPIQQTLFWAESASGQVFLRPVFGPMGSCPEGIEELKPTLIEKKENFS
ncbi:MAG: hypothetical protein WC858_01100 [Parcubacteria group bacterium]|jgi:hypothetical protein